MKYISFPENTHKNILPDEDALMKIAVLGSGAKTRPKYSYSEHYRNLNIFPPRCWSLFYQSRYAKL